VVAGGVDAVDPTPEVLTRLLLPVRLKPDTTYGN